MWNPPARRRWQRGHLPWPCPPREEGGGMIPWGAVTLQAWGWGEPGAARAVQSPALGPPPPAGTWRGSLALEQTSLPAGRCHGWASALEPHLLSPPSVSFPSWPHHSLSRVCLPLRRAAWLPGGLKSLPTLHPGSPGKPGAALQCGTVTGLDFMPRVPCRLPPSGTAPTRGPAEHVSYEAGIPASGCPGRDL